MQKNDPSTGLRTVNIIVLATVSVIVLATLLQHFKPFLAPPEISAQWPAGQNGTLHVATDRDYKPYSFFDEDGLPQGHDVELAMLLAGQMGMNLDLQMLPWEDGIEAVRSGKADVLMTCDYTDSFDGVEGMIKTEPTSLDDFVVWSKKPVDSPDDLYNTRNAVMRSGNVLATISLLGLDGRCIEYDDNRQALQAVSDGEADCAIMRNTVGTVLLREMGNRRIKAYVDLGQSYMCFGINPGKPELAERINSALEELKTEDVLENLRAKWLTSFVRPETFREFLSSNIWLMLGLLILAVAIVGQILLFRRHEEVRRKAAEEAEKYRLLIESYTKTYRTVLTVNLADGRYTVLKQGDTPELGLARFEDFRQLAGFYIANMVYAPDKTLMTGEMDFGCIRKRLKEESTYGVLYRMVLGGVPTWFQMVISAISGDEIVAGFRNRDEETVGAQIGDILRDSFLDLYIVDLDADQCRTVRSGSSFLAPKGEVMPATEAVRSLAATLGGSDREFFEGIADCGKVKDLLERDGKLVYLYPSPNFVEGSVWVKFELHVLSRFEGKPQTAMLGITLVDSGQKERMELLRRLAEKEALLSHFVKPYASAYSVNLKDDSFEILHMDHALSSVFKMDGDRSDMVTFIENHVHPDDRQTMLRVIDKDYVRKTLCTQDEIDFSAREILGGKERTMRGMIMKGVDENHIAIGFLDVTEEVEEERRRQKELQDALNMAEAANRSKTSFLFNMSHDIRTPMNAITGFTMMARKNASDSVKLTGYLDKIASAGDHLLELINKVLDMSRIESGKVELDFAPCDVIDHADAVVSIIRANADMKGLTVESSIRNVRDRKVLADAGRINQIFLNILGNAVKYTPEGGRVSFTAEQTDCGREGFGTYRFTVEDTGIGMSEEYIKTIFEPFSRERSATESKIEGTGLGMSIVKRLVDLMGGSIDIASEPGKGTRMTVTLTLELQEDVAGPVAESAPRVFNLAGRKVLLVEDNELNREIAKYLLEEQGLVVDEAADGRQAVEKVRLALGRGGAEKEGRGSGAENDGRGSGAENDGRGGYDFVLMDIQMPVMNGYEATRAIRALEMDARLVEGGRPEGGRMAEGVQMDDGTRTEGGRMDDSWMAEGVRRLPIIAMTANAFEEDRRNALEAGMDAHIVKPVNPEVLWETLSKFL